MGFLKGVSLPSLNSFQPPRLKKEAQVPGDSTDVLPTSDAQPLALADQRKQANELPPRAVVSTPHPGKPPANVHAVPNSTVKRQRTKAAHAELEHNGQEQHSPHIAADGAGNEPGIAPSPHVNDKFTSGQDVFESMKAMAAAVELLADPDDVAGKRRGRARAGKEKTLREALHDSWGGKVRLMRVWLCIACALPSLLALSVS